METNVIGIIQARSNSKRLPEKVFEELHGDFIIDWVCERVEKSKLLNGMIIATPNKDELKDYLYPRYETYEGSEQNVLYRIYRAAKELNATHIVRICADRPLIDPNEIDKLIKFYFDNQPCDYAYNHTPINNLYPIGFGAEIVSFDLFHNLILKKTTKDQEEHCFNYILSNKKDFIIKTFNPENGMQRPDLKFDVDTKEDLEYLRSKKFNINSTAKDIVKLFGE